MYKKTYLEINLSKQCTRKVLYLDSESEPVVLGSLQFIAGFNKKCFTWTFHLHVELIWGAQDPLFDIHFTLDSTKLSLLLDNIDKLIFQYFFPT